MSNSNSVCCFCRWEFVWTAWLLCWWQVVPFFPGRQNLCRHSLEVSSRIGGVGFELTNWRFDQKSSAIFSIHSIHLVIAWLLICWRERPSTTSLLCRFAKQECWQAQSSIQFERCWDFLSTWTHNLWYFLYFWAFKVLKYYKDARSFQWIFQELLVQVRSCQTLNSPRSRWIRTVWSVLVALLNRWIQLEFRTTRPLCMWIKTISALPSSLD